MRPHTHFLQGFVFEQHFYTHDNLQREARTGLVKEGSTGSVKVTQPLRFMVAGLLYPSCHPISHRTSEYKVRTTFKSGRSSLPLVIKIPGLKRSP